MHVVNTVLKFSPSRPSVVWLVVVLAHLALLTQAALPPRTRRYYIKAEEVDWDYAPAGQNLCTGQAFGDEENVFVANTTNRVGSIYRKAVFRRYTDQSFDTPVPHPDHLGSLGPYLHAVPGDKIVIELQNRAAFPVNFEADNLVKDQGNPDLVDQNETAAYTFYVTADSAPALDAYTSSMMHFYRSSLGGPSHIYAGLFGPLIVTRADAAGHDGVPLDVDREFVTVLWVSDENQSPYWNLSNAARAGMSLDEESELESDEELIESNLMHGINGMVYCNLPGLLLEKGPSRTRWYAGALGNEVDLHTLHWHSMVGVTLGGVHSDSVRLLAYSTETLDFAPPESGTWLLHCHIDGTSNCCFLERFAQTPQSPSSFLGVF
jgi:manganese oxidase